MRTYEGTRPTRPMLRSALPDVSGRSVVIIEDILDTGVTLSALTQALNDAGAESIHVAVLVEKSGNRRTEVKADFIGFSTGSDFIIGYGCDLNDEYRHLPHLARVVSES